MSGTRVADSGTYGREYVSRDGAWVVRWAMEPACAGDWIELSLYAARGSQRDGRFVQSLSMSMETFAMVTADASRRYAALYPKEWAELQSKIAAWDRERSGPQEKNAVGGGA